MPHHTDGSSIQSHSVGGHYPFVLVTLGERGVRIQAPDGSEHQFVPFTAPTPAARRHAYDRAGDLAVIACREWNAQRQVARAHALRLQDSPGGM